MLHCKPMPLWRKASSELPVSLVMTVGDTRRLKLGEMSNCESDAST